RIKEKINERIQTVLTHGQYIMGPEVRELEERLADYAGTTRAVGCASGTDALLLALMTYQIGPGDAIFTTPFTFIATAEVISLLGATPIFVDIDPKTFNLDPDKLELALIALKKRDPSIYPLPKSTGSRFSAWSVSSPNSLRGLSPSGTEAEFRTPNLIPKGIIPVDLFGLPADYERINAIAREHSLFVIEDAAQSFGGEYNGKKVGALSEIACTSFFPAKPLGGYGDGGMCFTNNDHLFEIMRSLRIHGQGKDKYENVHIGINGRLDALQAAVLLAKFEIFPEEIELRQQVAHRYSQLLSPLSVELSAPFVPSGSKSAWAQYSLLAKDEAHRSLLQARLKAASIPSAIYYPKPLHLQTAFAFLGYRQGDFPISEDYAKRIFSLPMHPYLKAEDQERVAKALEGTIR
ncbi:MAG: aminotransferase DegT, partial [Desulfobacca sp.]|nr:aminotransferase DegT [Desulfobacca sp.]